MATLVHITAEENKKSILNTGIKLGNSKIVYFMPHTKDFLISHQWARELKRSGIKNFIAVDFKIPNDEEIWFGKYTGPHEKIPLNKAIKLFLDTEDKLGYEFFLERKIESKEISKIRNIPKPTGWRYKPHAHGTRPCPCPMCIQIGGYKTNSLKEKSIESMSVFEAKKVIATSNDDDELFEAVIRLKGKWKKESPEFLERLLDSDDIFILYELVDLISEYRHPLTKQYLELLAKSSDEDVKEDALEYLKKYKKSYS